MDNELCLSLSLYRCMGTFRKYYHKSQLKNIIWWYIQLASMKRINLQVTWCFYRIPMQHHTPRAQEKAIVPPCAASLWIKKKGNYWNTKKRKRSEETNDSCHRLNHYWHFCFQRSSRLRNNENVLDRGPQRGKSIYKTKLKRARNYFSTGCWK